LEQYKFYTVEQGMGSGGETAAKSCVYEILENKVQTSSSDKPISLIIVYNTFDDVLKA